MSKTIQVELLTDGGYNSPAIVGKVFNATPRVTGHGYGTAITDLWLAGMTKDSSSPTTSVFFTLSEVRILDADN